MTDSNSKLISLIHTLSANELKQLQQYAQCDFLNKNKEAAALLSFIYKQHKKQKQIITNDRKKMYAVIYTKTAYDDAKMRRLMSATLKVVEDFLVYSAFQAKNVQRKIDLANIYVERGLQKHFDSAMRTCQKLQTNDKGTSEEYYHRQYQIENLKSKALSKQKQRKTEPNLQRVSDIFDAYYLTNKLRTCCTIYTYRNLFRYEYDVKMLDELLQHIAQNNYQHLPILQLYYHALLTLMQPEETQHFFNLKKLLNQHSDILFGEELGDLHVMARNYCIKKLNKGNIEFGHELFELYKLGLTQKLILENNVLYPWTYKNIVAVGLKLKEFEWTQNFIHEYKSLLPPKVQEGAYAFNLARLYFEKGDYNEVIGLLYRAEINDIFLNLSAKAMLLKTYYELEELTPLYSLLDSFKIFLMRKKGLGYHKDNYLNIIKYTKKLTNINHYDKEALKKLKAEISNIKVLTEKRWLLQKVDILIGG